MILSDEEIIKKWNSCPNADKANEIVIGFARDIERAVLAKASQSGYNRDSDEALGKSLSVYSDKASQQGQGEPLDETAGFIDFFDKRIDALADKHPALMVMQLAQLLRAERKSKAMPAPKQEPIYQYSNIHNVNLWTDCNKETYEIMKADFRRIVYEHPAQAAAIPESLTELMNACRKICYPMVTKESAEYVEAMQAALAKVNSELSAAPKPGDQS